MNVICCGRVSVWDAVSRLSAVGSSLKTTLNVASLAVVPRPSVETCTAATPNDEAETAGVPMSSGFDKLFQQTAGEKFVTPPVTKKKRSTATASPQSEG